MKKSICLVIALLVLIPLEIGAQSHQSFKGRLCIMSYNTHNAVGMDGKRDFKRIASIVAASNPDIVSLQELDSVTARNNGVYALKEIAECTGMNYVYGPAIDYDGGKYGIGILSKDKPLKVRYVSLPEREEARTLLIAEYDKFVFLATHFSLTPEDQVASAKIILKEVASMKKPVFLAGDMNSVPSSKPQKLLCKYFSVLTDCNWKTCEGECIDYIYGDKTARKSYSVSDKKLIEDSMASDHFPVVVTLSVHENK